MNAAAFAELLAFPDLEERLGQVEQILDDALVGNAQLVGPSRRVVGGGGKRLRPVLALAAATAGGRDVDDGALRAAASLELVHVGSLVHDDIIDDGTTRRGVPTVNALEGDDDALLVGDYLLGVAGGLAASVSREIAEALATAITELCIGQSLEMSTLYDPDRSVDDYLASIEGKTAALLRGSCRIGALSGGLADEVVSALVAYGTAFGMAFQIVDDVLDVVASEQELGKPVGKDVREGVYTLPVLLTARTHPELRDRLGREATDGDAEAVLDAVRASPAIKECVDAARDYAAAAAEALGDVEPLTERTAGLARLPSWYVDRSIGDR